MPTTQTKTASATRLRNGIAKTELEVQGIEKTIATHQRRLDRVKQKLLAKKQLLADKYSDESDLVESEPSTPISMPVPPSDPSLEQVIPSVPIIPTPAPAPLPPPMPLSIEHALRVASQVQ